MDYSIGDSVLIRSDELKKKVIGCIEEIDVVDGVFRYGLYVSSKEVPKRQYYHGNFELLKTSSSFEDKLTSIEKCVEVLKFKDYVMREQPTEELPFYIVRQYYDMDEETLTPQEPKPCICNRVVNPDGNLVMCLNCTDLFYHDTCLAPGAKCSGCMSILKEENLVGFKRTTSAAALPSEIQIESLQLKQLSSSQAREDDLQEEIEPTKMNIDVDKMKEMFEQARLANLRKQEDRRRQQTAMNKAASSQASNRHTALKREGSGTAQSLEFNNLSAADNEKIQTFVSRYKRFNPTGNLVGPEKKRMEVREKFFEYMVYGLLEMESTETILTDDERRFIKQDFYEIARKLAVEIESNIFNVNNRSNKYALTDNYKQRCKLLFSNMRDGLNFHLRRSIINKSIKPLALCTMTEIELYNPTKLKEIQNQQMKLLDRDTISLSDKMYIFKTSKGEEIIAMREEVAERNEDDNNDQNNHLQSSASKSRTTSAAKNDYYDQGESQAQSQELLASHDNIESRSNTPRNPLFDPAIVESLLNFVGEKSLKRIRDRITSDLPEKEAKYLLNKFSC